MLKRILTAGAVATQLIVPAYAADPPASAEECHKLHTEIDDTVGKATIPADTKTKLDELFAKLKGH